MKIIKTTIFVLSVAFLSIVFVQKSFGAEASFNRTLRFGMSGEDVKLLQQILNRDPVTQIANIGPGSPGQESSYFGNLTKNAVIKFQEKYKEQILFPNGLNKGTGFVGISTITVLNGLANSQTISKTENGNIQTNKDRIASTTPSSSLVVGNQSSGPNSNPNSKNLNTFLSAVEKVSYKQGLSTEKIAQIRGQILKDVATSTDLQSEFIKILENKRKISESSKNKSLFSSLFEKVLLVTEKALKPKTARAITGSPFGGALLFSFYCSCSDSWLLTLQPLPPTFVTLLNYFESSQAYLSYNIPLTTWLLGEYTSGAGVCLIPSGTGCVDVPSEGLITPTVGSSAE